MGWEVSGVSKQGELNELALFAGAGGGILGGKLLGWRTVCAVEWEPYPASVLCARQNDGLLPPFPIWDDVQTFDGKPWQGIVDVVSGGFPCQDISAAGGGAGIDGERSGMWREMARIIHEVRPRFAFVETSPMLTSRGLGTVLGDLASMGFDAKWGVLGAADVGAPHQRDRIWIVAKWRGQLPHAQHDRIRWWEQQQKSLKEAHGKVSHTASIGHQVKTDKCLLESQGRDKLQPSESRNSSDVANAQMSNDKESKNQNRYRERSQGESGRNCSVEGEIPNSSKHRIQSKSSEAGKPSQWINSSGIGNPEWWAVEPNVGRVVNGMASRVDRLKAIGNGQVPLCAATAWRILNAP